MSEARLRGLYSITPDAAPDLCAAVAAALRGGARLIQYRGTHPDPARRHDEARQLRALCDAAGALLIVNDDPALAVASGADGVHLGRNDPPIETARDLLGPGAVIGASCYDSLARAEAAARAGADYIAFGSFFPSPTKPDAVRAAPELLNVARASFDLPLCAIGGITPDNGGELVAAGADMLAVISGVFGVEDIEAAARAYARLFATARRSGWRRP